MFFEELELQQVQPQHLIPLCGSCGLYKGCKSPKMEPSGQGRRKVLIVAEAPGEEEDRKGTQLVGKTGRMLQSVLNSIGVDMRRDCWLTNALICRPPGNEIVDKRQVDYCRPNLIKTIERLQPDVVLLLGFMAVKSLIPHLWHSDIGKGIGRWVGWNAPAQRINAWVCPTWHPSYLLRSESATLDAGFRNHIVQAFSLKGKPWSKVPDFASQVDLLYKVGEITSFLKGIDSGMIAFDYETNMLKPDSSKARIVSCSICWNGKQTVAFPMLPGVQQPLSELLGNPNVWKIAQNMKFEDRWTRKILGVQVKGWRWDSMLAAHLLDCRPDITGLKFLSFVHLGQKRYDTHVEPYFQTNGCNTVNRIKDIPLNTLLTYNGLDSLFEYLIAIKQMEEMQITHAKTNRL